MTAKVGPRSVALLELFGDGRSCAEVLSTMVPGLEPPELISDLLDKLTQLIELGMLQSADEQEQSGTALRAEPFQTFDQFDYHARMLSDARRVTAYADAIAAMVAPNSVVLEIGAGTGILSVLAAKRGARVLSIERENVIEMARQMVAEADIGDRVTLFAGKSGAVELPERADLLVCELVGNRILNEGLLESVLDARRRLLRAGASVVPRALRVVAYPIEYGFRERYGERLQGAGARVGISLQPMLRWLDEYLSKHQVVDELGAGESVNVLGPATRALEVDLLDVETAGFESAAALHIHEAGRLDAVLLAFELELCAGVELDNRIESAPTHWKNPLYVLPAARNVRPGDRFDVRLRYESQSGFSVLPAA